MAQLACRILSVGDELLVGRIIDSNAAEIAAWAWTQGFQVLGVEQCGDAQHSIVAALERAMADADLIVVSGGLGPTDDDRTRAAVATALGVPVVTSVKGRRLVQLSWDRLVRDRAMPEINFRQAMMPRGAVLLTNPVGTAPGFVAWDRTRSSQPGIACVPGVPREMRSMLPVLAKVLKQRWPRPSMPWIREAHLAGLTESGLHELMPDLLHEADPMVGVTVQEAGHLTVRAVGSRPAVNQVMARLGRTLGEYVLPAPGLAASIVKKLGKRRVACAESCTGGLLAAALTDVPGASAVLGSSWVVYDPAAKISLGVDPDLLDRSGSVCAEVACQLAEQARTKAGVFVGVGITGLAGPGGGTRKMRVGTVFIALSSSRSSRVESYVFPGNRQEVRRRARNAALLLLWQMLQPTLR